MAKKKTSISVDKEIHERLQNDPHINVSGLVNDLLKEYYATGVANGLDLRKQRVRDDLERARQKVSQLEEQMEKLRQNEEYRKQKREENIEQALDKLRDIPGYRLTVDNPAIVTQANKHGLKPEKLLRRSKEDRPNSDNEDR